MHYSGRVSTGINDDMQSEKSSEINLSNSKISNDKMISIGPKQSVFTM